MRIEVPPIPFFTGRLRAAGMSRWLGLLVALVVSVSGCAKGMSKEASMGPGSVAPAMMDAEMDYGGGEAYRGDDGADVYAQAKRMEAADLRELDANMDDADYGPSPSPPPEPSPTKAKPQKAEPNDPTEPAPAHGRQIIYTASMRIGVFKVDEAVKQAELMPEQFGGWIHERRNDYVQMKIPAAKLEAVMESVSKLGRVEDRQLDANDVTAEFVDLQSRIKVMRHTQKQLLTLLEQAKTVEEALAVRQALDRVVMELEVAEGRMRQLKNMISFSTLTVQFVEQAPHVITAGQNDPFPWVDSLGVEATEWN